MASGVDTNRSVKKLLGRQNYDTWKVYAKSYLVIRELWKYTQEELADNATTTEKENNLKAWSEINLLVDETVLSYILDTQTAKQAWDSLQSAFEDSGLCRKVELLKQLVQLTLSKCASVEDYINRITMTSSKVKRTGLKLDDEVIASLMLAGLPEEYKPLVMAIENSSTKLTIDSVKTLLLQETRLNPEPDNGEALCVNAKRSKTTHGVTKFRCHKCGVPGHFAKECSKNYTQNGTAEEMADNFVARKDCPQNYIRNGATDDVIGNFLARKSMARGEPF